MVFSDEGASSSNTKATGTPTPITDWTTIKANLDFTVYLPATLPTGTCLMSASGTLHDPIFGSSFTIGFLLPDHDSLSLSEAPLRSQTSTFQCSVSATATPPDGSSQQSTPTGNAQKAPIQLCTGAREKTNIVFSSRGNTNDLQTFFHDLQSNVNWIPAS